MIYVPNLQNQNCVVLQNSTTLRVYDTRPTQNSQRTYKEYYLNNHYLFNSGIATFGSTSTLPTCRTDITNDFFYRTDITDILLCTFILSILIFYLPYKLMRRLWLSK